MRKMMVFECIVNIYHINVDDEMRVPYVNYARIKD